MQAIEELTVVAGPGPSRARLIGDPGQGPPPLLAIHPVGVGLSSRFWDRFARSWVRRGERSALLLPDLLGCGASAHPCRPFTPADWAAPLATHLREHLGRPSVLLVQGASLPIALELIARELGLVRALVMVGPPAWPVMGSAADPRFSQLLWNVLFRGPLGRLFYRWARRRAFLRSFSERELFADPADVDGEWLDMLEEGAAPMSTRWAVFSFLAGFWRRDYHPQMRSLTVPVLALFGERASGISRGGRRAGAAERVATYTGAVGMADGRILPGRNVLPYESTEVCVAAVADWIAAHTR
jgi:pimeloyl-ACP methyl ester carboxylesterase